jgi:hypothetical protein
MPERRVAALDVSSDIPASEAVEHRDEQLHGQYVSASNIDASEERDVRVHLHMVPK